MEIKTIYSAIALLAATTGSSLLADEPSAASVPPKVPAFSVDYMDRSVCPATNFYQFADGQWLKDNPVPPDKSRWASFSELAERNWYLIHGILDDAARRPESLPPSIRPRAKSAISSPPPWTPTALNSSGFKPHQRRLETD